MRQGGPIISQQLGNYLIQEPLGRGGMARVYKGLDTMLKRPVAVKVIEEGLRASGSYATRFEREARAVANLKHPNIVNVYYFGVQDNLYYLVMEYIEGTDLDAILHNYADQNELMPYADAMHILEAIASALDYAHGQSVIHRDVKPANIMLERSGRPVLTDFGLALKVSEGTIGETFGTPHYISPEQARNSADAVPQSDLYSLGVVAYELLTGALPFEDPSPTALAMQHILAAVPSPRAFNPNLSLEVEQILFRALAKTPGERYESGAAFCEALRHGLETTLRSGVQPSAPPPPQRAESTRPRRISMQSALDKVDQELAAQQAKAQVPATQPSAGAQVLTDTWRAVNSSSWLPYVVTTAVVLAGLLIFALLIGGQGGGADAATPTAEATLIAAAGATSEPSEEPAPAASETPTPPLTNTSAPPTFTPIPPSLTVAAATFTPAPPSATPITPSPLPVLSSATPEPTSIPAAVPTDEATAAPSAAPSDWLPVTFYYDADGFWWVNDSSRSISAQYIRFEKGGGEKSFNGSQWAYWTLEPGRCMEIRFADVSNPARPNGCRPNAFFTPTRTQDADFWTGTGRFRVFWNGVRIAVCQIEDGRCSASVPPT